MRAVETATQTLHRLTSYTWGWYLPSLDDPQLIWSPPADDPRILLDLKVNDLDRLPWFYKRYPDSLSTVLLPRELPSTSTPALGVLAGRADLAGREIDLPHLSRLLHLSAGVVRTTERPWGTFLFRAAGSAGGRFPLELYVAVPDGGPLPAGVHWYDPREHALVLIGPPPVGRVPTVVVTGVPWRTGWRYRERGFRHVYWDAGSMLAQMIAAADSAGIPATLYAEFPDATVARLVGADGSDEWPVAVVALGDGPPAVDPTGTAAAGQVDAGPVEFPLVTAAQRSGESESFGSAWPRGVGLVVAGGDDAPLEAVVLTRGSQRRMDPARGLRQEVLRTSLDVALRGTSLPHWVVVHDVDGVAPGVYRWPDLSAPQLAGELRQELYRVCMEQALGRDAAFVVIAGTDVSALNDREYREAQLGAGLVSGRLHLVAYGLGASATGMTFIDSEVPALLGGSFDALLFTCVGVADNTSKVGGQPGAPTAVRSVPPRD
jgi:hypothetical protein